VFQSNGSEFILQSNETKEDAPQRNGFRKFAINKARTININNDEDVKSYSWKGRKPLFFMKCIYVKRLFGKELRNNSTVFEELEVSIVDLMVANAVLLATRSMSTADFTALDGQ
jgi:hypothetical protein